MEAAFLSLFLLRKTIKFILVKGLSFMDGINKSEVIIVRTLTYYTILTEFNLNEEIKKYMQ